MPAKKGSKKKSRIFLDSPWAVKCSHLTADDEVTVLQEVESIISKYPELKRNPKYSGRKRSPLSEKEEREHEQWINYRKQLEIGINSVTRGLEKDCIGAVLFCSSPDPALLTKHILPLCVTRNVPVVGLKEMNKIAKLMNISCLTALGLKREAEQDASVFHCLWKCIKDKAIDAPYPIKLFQANENGTNERLENAHKTTLFRTKMKHAMPSGKVKLKK